MKITQITSEQFDKMMTRKLTTHHNCCSDIFETLAGIAMGSGLVEAEAKKRCEKAMDMMEDALQRAGDEIVRHA